MKRRNASLIALAASLAMGSAMAAQMSAAPEVKPRVIPVLVHVDNTGHVTRAVPAVKLDRSLQNLLVEDLNQWITKPAYVKDKAVASQIVMKVALHTQPRADGSYQASFEYVSAVNSPVTGAAYWGRNAEGQLVLIGDGGLSNLAEATQRPDYNPPYRQADWSNGSSSNGK